ncbi:hypothetical protein M758_3G218900 [Ceratodon purpureus]|nr:hypothetical protein M758_3G218900 [Ceratodon purpureus]
MLLMWFLMLLMWFPMLIPMGRTKASRLLSVAICSLDPNYVIVFCSDCVGASSACCRVG